MARKTKRAAPCGNGKGGALESKDGAGGHVERKHSPAPSPRQSALYVDKFGHLHGESILTAWSPQALKVMGVHRVDEGRES